MKQDTGFSEVEGQARAQPLHAAGLRPVYPWREALVWMVLLGMLFIFGYRATNVWAAQQSAPISLHLAWDGLVPFVPWTIWPYLSLNLIFPCTLFACDSRPALRRHVARVLLVMLACFAVFVLLPSVNVRVTPHADGVAGVLFAQLRAFEQPFNMFPSLHAAMLLLVWRVCLPGLRGHPVAAMAWHGWCALILLSTLTTWQHDVLDVLAGLLLAWVALFVLPMKVSAR